MIVKVSISHEVPEGVERVIVVSRGTKRSKVNIPNDKAFLVDGMSSVVKECLRQGHLQTIADRARGKAPYLSLELIGVEKPPVGEPKAEEKPKVEEKPETIPPTAEVERPAVKPKLAEKKVVKKDGVKRKRIRKRSNKN